MNNILLIEDDADCAESLGMLLDFHGHAVQIAASAQEGIACALSADFDVVITDLGLPDMDGLDLLRRLAEIVDPVHCMTVALTGYAGADVREAVRQIGVDHFFVKGAEIAPLLALIGSHVR